MPVGHDPVGTAPGNAPIGAGPTAGTASTIGSGRFNSVPPGTAAPGALGAPLGCHAVPGWAAPTAVIASGRVSPVSGSPWPRSTSAVPIAEVGCSGGTPDFDFVAGLAGVIGAGPGFGGTNSPTSGSPLGPLFFWNALQPTSPASTQQAQRRTTREPGKARPRAAGLFPLSRALCILTRFPSQVD